MNPWTLRRPGDNVWVLTSDDWELDRVLLPRYGAKNYPTYGWVYIGPTLPEPLRAHLPPRHSWETFVARSLLTGTPPTGNPEPDMRTGTYTLRPDQEEDVQTFLRGFTLGMPEMLNASDVGAGKTVTSIAVAKRLPGVRRILVACPKTLIPAWRRTIDDMGDGGKEWVLINYQSTKKLLTTPPSALTAKKQSTKNQRTVSQGVARAQFDLVIRDEGHWCANPESQQTRVVDKVIEGPPGTPAARVLTVTATPGENPAKVSYLHRGLAYRTGQRPAGHITSDEYIAWCEKYGFGVEKGFGNHLTWKYRKQPDQQAPDIRKLHHLIFSARPPWAIRRVPDWPSQRRYLTPIELTPHERAAYDTEWSQFLAASQHLHEARVRHDTAPSKASAELVRQAQKMTMGQAVRYQQKAALLRVPSTAEFIETMVLKDRQVAVSCQHLLVVEALRDRLEKAGIPTCVYTGTNSAERETERIRFQRGETKVILFTITEGLNLNAGETAVGGNDVPRVSVVAQPRWSPRQALQLEGRGQRNGQEAPCYYMFAVNTVEEDMLRVVIPAMRNALAVVGSDTTAMESLSARLGVPLEAISLLKD